MSGIVTLKEECFRGTIVLRNIQGAEENLGSLVPWWFRREALEQIGASPAGIEDLPKTPGACWILCVNRDTRSCEPAIGNSPPRGLLRPAYLFPLQWKLGTSHGALPITLRNMADQVVELLGRMTGHSSAVEKWGLHLAAGSNSESIDLSQFEGFKPESGCASLIGGLWGAIHGNRPVEDVWATGVWDFPGQWTRRDFGSGIANVADDTLPLKVQLAEEYGVGRLFVPERQFDLAESLRQAESGLRIGKLKIDSSPHQALGRYLAGIKAEPGLDAVFDELRDHHHDLCRLDRVSGPEFYARRLLPEIIRRIQQRFRDQYGFRIQNGELPRITSLVTVLSSPELIPIAIKVAGAERTLVLYSKEMEAKRATAEKLFRTCDIPADAVDWRLFDSKAIEDGFKAEIQDFVIAHGDAHMPMVFDLTPGQKHMNYLFAFQFAKTERDLMIYLRHEAYSDLSANIVKPGTERMLMWKAGERWESKTPLLVN